MLHLSLLIACIGFTAFAIFLCINHLFTFTFLFVERSLNKLKNPVMYTNITGWQFLRACAIEFVYMISKFYLFPFKFVNLTIRPKANQPSECAVLLIHGYLRNQSDWLWFRKQILSLGFPIYTINLTPRLGSIQEISFNSINDKIAQIKQQTNCKEIILIGHSMGGLIANYYSEYCDEAALIKRVISIAAPFHGTTISVLAAGANAKQMLPDAIFTNDLREKIAKSKRQHFEIATQLDNIIFPWQSALLESTPQKQQLILSSTSHLALLHSDVVAKQVIQWLTS